MQTKSLHIFDYLVFLVYFVIVAGYGYYIYRKKKKATTDSKDFFLAEGSLTWWAIGASLIASNISAEQFIGMSGNGFNIGLAISTYEWMAAATLIVVAVFFLPIYLKNKIYTMPQFLERRYNQTVSTIMAVFWLLLYVVVNLTSILYLGALAVSTISGINFYVCMVALAFFAILITLGGMKVIGYTDVIQVFFLILGGLATTYLALQLVSSHFGTTGVLKGFSLMTQHASEHFHMILHKENPKYLDLPGLSVLIGGMWIVNLNYWGCNQYITQRALGADLKTARSGLLFAGFLKLLMPVIVVLPGIAAYVLYSQNHGDFAQSMMKDGSLNADNAYPVLLNLLPVGLKGLAFAALTAAVVASLAGKANSISTIFSLDIYKKIYNKDADEKKVVGVGRAVVIITMIIAIVISNFLGIDKKGGFQFIQEYTGFVSPGVFAMFALGFFWKRTTSNAAMFAMIGGLLLSFILKFLPAWVNLEPLHQIGFAALNPDSGLWEMAFIDRMGLVFVVCVVGMIIITLTDKSSVNNPKGLAIDSSMFKPNMGFTVGALLIVGILIALYTVFW
ncbi:sodium/solute symporter [Chitinophaga polysaccharea]|uniref:sodium/sugar symporter n=1 Tax=Chitinophaga TaxID=79328 RepID=UPI0014555FFD|nr:MULTISPECIES: sodium/sugar symporter [Chitinophaga]NLR61236.1 sodium/solute symporter [Chitinophaga polysaccharea]NLU95072.1 sodium/solute symporter [Chitinophaga sp. Ak27]